MTELPDISKGLAQPEPPDLTDWSDTPKKRRQFFDRTIESVSRSFPKEHKGVRLELHDLHYADPEDIPTGAQKKALMSNGYLNRRLRGTWKLFDVESNEELDSRKETVMKVPYLTNRGTFVHGGNEYVTLHQARLDTGAYSRVKANGATETQFNLRRGTGNNFRVELEPETGLFRMKVGGSNLRLYSLLHDLGVPDEDLEKSWGPELLAKNREAYDSRTLDKAYRKLVRRPADDLDVHAKVAAIRQALDDTRMSRATLRRTLPELAK